MNIYNADRTRIDFIDNNAAADSLILIKGFGGEENKIDWQVMDENSNLLKSGTTIGIPIPRLDTLKNKLLNY